MQLMEVIKDDCQIRPHYRRGGGVQWNIILSCENRHKINLVTRESFVLNACIVRLLLSTSMKLASAHKRTTYDTCTLPTLA